MLRMKAKYLFKNQMDLLRRQWKYYLENQDTILRINVKLLRGNHITLG